VDQEEVEQVKELSYLGIFFVLFTALIAGHIQLFGAAANAYNSMIIAANYFIVSAVAYIIVRHDIDIEILEEKDESVKVQINYETRW
jgi:hypothetical protein